jgi:hypothetical protein
VRERWEGGAGVTDSLSFESDLLSLRPFDPLRVAQLIVTHRIHNGDELLDSLDIILRERQRERGREADRQTETAE